MTTLAPSRPHPHLYEINTWAWLEELSRKAGRKIDLGQVPDREWDGLQARGFDFVWLMGIWQRSPESRRVAQTDPTLAPGYDAALPGWRPEDVVGSPYAVRAYEPDPRMGDWVQIDAVRAKLHERGLRLILDFVPNHTARDHAWVTTHPEYYIQTTEERAAERPSDFFLMEGPGPRRAIAHGRDPYFPPWVDTAQLNYFHPQVRQAMISELRRLAQHCDGVRCDMAMLLLNSIFPRIWGGWLDRVAVPEREFWSEAREAVPALLLIAEVYWDLEWELQRLGFDFTYDKRLYDRMREGPARDIAAHLSADPGYQAKLVRFLENHDEPRSLEVFGKDRLPAAATLLATLPGMRFYHHGQLEGRRRRLPVQLTSAAEEPPDEHCARLYHHLLQLAAEDVFHHGTWRLLTVLAAGDGTHDNLLAYEWRLGEAWCIVVVNVAASDSRGYLDLAEGLQHVPRAAPTVRLVDKLRQREQHVDAADLRQQGLPLHLSPFQAHVWAVLP